MWLDGCVLARAMDGDGDGFGGDVVACLISLVRCHPSHEEMMRRRDEIPGRGVLSHFRPTPLSSVLSHLLALNNPPPPGGGMSWRSVGLRLRAGRRFACFPIIPFRSLAIARSLLRSGSSCGAMLLGLSYSAVKAFQCGGGMGWLIVSFVVPPVLIVSRYFQVLDGVFCFCFVQSS